MAAPLRPLVVSGPCRDDSREDLRLSCGEISAAPDPVAYRRHFARRWQAFITSSFDSPAHAARAFGVDPSTAENWFAGTNAPQGWVVGMALGMGAKDGDDQSA